MRLLRFVLPFALLAAPASAQFALSDDLRLDVAGGIQPRVGFGVEDGAADDTRYGVGLRRARIQARVLYRDVAGVEYDVEGGSGTIQSVDLFAFANLSDQVQARVGYVPVAQPRGAVLTPYFLIDAVDRATIAERWMAGTLGGDGRDLAVDVTYAAGGTRLTAAVHNGSGSFARDVGNYREGISSPDVVNGPESDGFAVSAAGSVEVGRGVEVGAFASTNSAAPDRTSRAGRDRPRGYSTGGAHVYWGALPGSQPVRLKLDALAIRYFEDGQGNQVTAGTSALAAVRVLGAGEAFGRAEWLWTDAGRDFGLGLDADVAEGFFTAGLSYSPSAARGGPYERARVTLAYHFRASDAFDEAHLVLLQGQLAF
jgi:hypothetical protein